VAPAKEPCSTGAAALASGANPIVAVRAIALAASRQRRVPNVDRPMICLGRFSSPHFVCATFGPARTCRIRHEDQRWPRPVDANPRFDSTDFRKAPFAFRRVVSSDFGAGHRRRCRPPSPSLALQRLRKSDAISENQSQTRGRIEPRAQIPEDLRVDRSLHRTRSVSVPQLHICGYGEAQ